MDGSWKLVEFHILAGGCVPGSMLKWADMHIQVSVSGWSWGALEYTHHQKWQLSAEG